MDEDEKIKEKVEKFNQKLKESALGINYIQPKWKDKFLEISKLEYGNDHGVTLKELTKHFLNFYPKGNEEVEAKIDVLADEINEIKSRLGEISKDPGEAEFTLSADGSKKIRKRWWGEKMSGRRLRAKGEKIVFDSEKPIISKLRKY